MMDLNGNPSHNTGLIDFEVITKQKGFDPSRDVQPTLDNLHNFRISQAERKQIIHWLAQNNVTIIGVGDYSISCQATFDNFTALENGFLNRGEMRTAVPVDIRDIIFFLERQEMVSFL